MGHASLLNWVICALVLLGVVQLIYVANQQADAAAKKTEMKDRLDSLLLHLNGQIKDFNSSVSIIRTNKLKAGTLRKAVPATHNNGYDGAISPAPPQKISSSGLFSPRSPLPKPTRAPTTHKSDIASATTATGSDISIDNGSRGSGNSISKAVTAGTGTNKKALLFTMDSISSYEANSKRGGAAGELLIRHSLEHAFKTLGVHLDVMTSDAAFLKAKSDQYDIIIVDPWTWAAKGWVPKPLLRNQVDKVYVLDFFGSERLPKEKPSFRVPASRFLTAFGYPGNQFLGFFMDEGVFRAHKDATRSKLQQGVIWGKDPNHFSRGRDKVLAQVANMVELHSTASRAVFSHSNVVWHGHQDRDGWLRLLAQSKFLIGLGDPLLGPSAIDAVSMGCVYINPIHESPVRGHFTTQHDYAMEKIGAPYVCNAHLQDANSVKKCVQHALKADLPPFIPPDFQHDAYIARVKSIFSLP